jgi:hypothetical protein
MKRIIALVGLATLSSFFWGVGVEPVNGQASCQATVDAVTREMRKKGTNVDFDVYQGGRGYEPSLGNTVRVDHIVFGLGGTSRSDRAKSVAWDIVYGSPVLLKGYASRIFSSCGGTGYVTFFVSNTGISTPFGMTDDGTFTVEQCSDNLNGIVNRVSSVGGPGPGDYCAYVIPDF